MVNHVFISYQYVLISSCMSYQTITQFLVKHKVFMEARYIDY